MKSVASPQKQSAKLKNNGCQPWFEAKLWLAADKLRNHRDAAEYKHVVLGLNFLKYISETPCGYFGISLSST